MKLPSIHALINSLVTTFLRFTIPILLAVTGAIVGILLIDILYDETDTHYLYNNIIMSCYIGMLLLIAVTIYTESKKWGGISKALLQAGALILVVGYYFSLPLHYTQTGITRFVSFALGLHLLIAVIPFIGKKENNGFWQYNKTLFLRILNAILYSSVLYIGLLLALVAIENLFNAHVNKDLYTDLWIAIVGIFNTCFFLAGFPRNTESLNTDSSYPKGLKVFTQYILLPLVTVYLLILYAYMGRIIITATWPAGWVGWLVILFSVGGILSLLLIYPIRNDDNNKWILTFSRFFYFAICPLIVLLLLAAQRRIREYGITELRYFIVVLGLWLAAIAGYFLVSSQKNIKLIPLSLCILAFITSFGPWGAFSISSHSQQNRLIKVLTKNNLFNGQKIVPATKSIPSADAKEITATLKYIIENDGYNSLKPWLEQNLDSVISDNKKINYSYSYQQANKLMTLINVKYTDSDDEEEDGRHFFDFDNDDDHITTIRGYDYLIREYTKSVDDSTVTSYSFNKDSLQLCVYDTSAIFLIRHQGDSTIHFDLGALAHSLDTIGNKNETTLTAAQMTLTGNNKHMAVTLLIKNISGSFKGDTTTIRQFTTDVLVRLKDR